MKKIFTIVLLSLAVTTAKAQIPNPSFETWDSITVPGVPIPVGWDNLDSVIHSLFSTGPFTCEEGSPGAVGSHYLKLTTKSILSSNVPGAAISGKFAFSGTTTVTPKSGFAFTSRPLALTGKWQYITMGADVASITVFLSKWNTALNKRDTIVNTKQSLTGTVTSWTPFSFNLNYLLGETPDTCAIVCVSSGSTPQLGSFLYLDTLAFQGTFTGVTSMPKQSFDVSLFPNPATNTTCINYYSPTGKAVTISVTDLTGKEVVSVSPMTMPGANIYSLGTNQFAAGLYFVKIVDEDGIQVLKLIVQ